MKAAHDGLPVEKFAVPTDIVLVRIDTQTGLRAMPGDPGAVLQAYRRGTEPAQMAIAYGSGDAGADLATRDFFRNEDF